MSALPPKADMVQRDRDVRYVPQAEVGARIARHPLSDFDDWQTVSLINSYVRPTSRPTNSSFPVVAHRRRVSG